MLQMQSALTLRVSKLFFLNEVNMLDKGEPLEKRKLSATKTFKEVKKSDGRYGASSMF
jgi:hypothetical protein